MVRDEQMQLQLNNIIQITNSDIVAFAMLESDSRKLKWKHLIGATSARTYKVKQSATAGLTGQALRTGKPQYIYLDTIDERFCFGEAIMVTESLVQAHVWPVHYDQYQYRGVIIVGKKQNQKYTTEQIEKASAYVELINQQLITNSLLV